MSDRHDPIAMPSSNPPDDMQSVHNLGPAGQQNPTISVVNT